MFLIKCKKGVNYPIVKEDVFRFSCEIADKVLVIKKYFLTS